MWDTYEARLGVPSVPSGDAVRDTRVMRAQDRTSRWITESVSFHDIQITSGDGSVIEESRHISIRNTPEYDTKRIYSMPNETLPHGSLVFWDDNYWLITEVDRYDDIYMRGKMRQCNQLLKWINDDGELICRWGVVEDGTKYIVGEKTRDLMSIGDARVALTIGKDSETQKLRRGRRFLLDDVDAEEVLAYQITKPNRLFKVYNNAGAYRFVLSEVNSTDDDNKELRIADYYNWHPRYKKPVSDVVVDKTTEEIIEDNLDEYEDKEMTVRRKGVWL